MLCAQVDDVASFVTLTDDALIGPLERLDPDSTEHPARIRKAQALWKRVLNRELYCFCDEVGGAEVASTAARAPLQQ